MEATELSLLNQFKHLLKELDIPPCDLLLIGDGSGTMLPNSCGWHVSAFLPKHDKYAFFHGGASSGTNNYAELMPYIHVLWHIDAKRKNKGPYKVEIVTDSELTANCGSGKYSRKANRPLWAAIEWFESNNYEIGWRWVPRNTNYFSKLADKRAGEIRKMMTL